MKKTWIALLLALCLVNPLQTLAKGKAFEDIPSTSPYYYAVEYLRQNNVFPEAKKFNPKQLVTKAEFVKYLVKLNSPDFKPGKKVKLPFKDTQDSAVYAPYFDEAIQLGILDDRDEKAEPYKKLNIIEASELIFHSASIPIPKVYVGTMPYKDLEQNKRAQPLIMRALEFDLFEPESSDNVGIYKKITRADAAMMIYKMDLVQLTPPSKVGQQSGSGSGSLDPSVQKVADVFEILKSNFYDKERINTAEMQKAAIDAMVKTLNDPYTTYMNGDENKAFSDDLDGQIEGIGAYLEIDKETGAVIIVSPIKDSPAFKAGIKPGDIIKKVDGKDIEGITLYDVVGRIKGKKGTTVEITVLRGSQTLTIPVVRDVVLINALETEIRGDIMIIKLNTFNQNASAEFNKAVDSIVSNTAIKGVILDLRNNPGGLLDAAVRILGRILPPDSKAVTIAYSYFNYSENTHGKGELSKYPFVILINKGSASASEIVAGAAKDLKVATLVGEKSFGKGTVQEINYFSDNSSLKVTIAKWLTPNGTSIQEKGIEPDIAVEQPQNSSTDAQMDRALQEVRRLMK
jgi:C-terminal peptidase prc